MRAARLALFALSLVGCATAPAATPIVIYVTPAPTIAAPTSPVPLPSSLVASPSATPLVTAAPATPRPAPTPTHPPTPVPTAATHTILVYLTLNGRLGTDFKKDDVGCQGIGGYNDITTNQQFEIKDASGALLGFGSYDISFLGDGNKSCTFSGFVENVPLVDVYVIGNERRGFVDFTAADLEANSWSAILSIGS